MASFAFGFQIFMPFLGYKEKSWANLVLTGYMINE